MNIIEAKWKKNHDFNMQFWRRKLPYKAKTFNHDFPLPDYFAPMIGDKREIWIADLGAGVVATTGNTWVATVVHLYPSDIYADEFKELWRDYGVEQWIPMEKQIMEYLTYEDEMFDIIHCANALDHTINPFKALQEMYRVCKPGGWIYLRHNPDNGKKRRYSMQHQWNISATSDDCLFWNYQDKFLLSECIKGFKTVEKRELPDEPITVVSTYNKP